MEKFYIRRRSCQFVYTTLPAFPSMKAAVSVTHASCSDTKKSRTRQNGGERPDILGGGLWWGGTEKDSRSLNWKLGAKGEGVGWRVCASAQILHVSYCPGLTLPLAVSMTTC